MDSTGHTSESIEERLLAVTAWLASYHSRPFSKTAVQARLPDEPVIDPFDRLTRMLDAIGLKTRVIQRELKLIDPGSLPVVVLDAQMCPQILVGLDTTSKTAELYDPVLGEMSTQQIGSLSGDIQSSVLQAAPKEAVTASRLSPEAVDVAAPNEHWLWSELARHKASWLQVFLAAFGVNLAGLALPIFVMNVFDRVIPNLAFVTLVTLAIGVALALALDLALRVLRSAIIQRVSRRADLSIASNLFGIALRQRMLSRKGGASGAITNLRDFELVRDFFTSSTVVSVIDLFFIGLFLLVLQLIVGPLAWVPIAAIPVMLALAFLAQVPISRSVKQAQQMHIKRNVVLIEAMSGLETIKSIGAEPVLQREWENAIAASSRVNAKTRNWATFIGSSSILIQQIVSATIICWGVFLVADGTISIGALVAANILAGRILSPLAGIAQTVFRANFAISSVRSINSFLEADTEHARSLKSGFSIREGRVRLQEVRFSYPGAKVPALDSVSLEFEPGTTSAVLGRIGSGKSTLGKLLNGILEPDQGVILIDGHEISQYETAELRKGIGYLSQDPLLFTGTIRENITMGAPSASEADITRALYLAGLDSFIATHPEGLNLFIGERGERLSGGQRQALSLARLLLRRPKVMFLDEPTNAMDHQTEALVIERLKELQREGVVLILSTHRMSLAAIAERYIVLEQGRVALNGPKEVVMQQLRGDIPKVAKRGG